MNPGLSRRKMLPSTRMTSFTRLWSVAVVVVSLLAQYLPSASAGLMVAYSTELDQDQNMLMEEDYIVKFHEIWMLTFLWAFISIFLVHALATVIALATLRKHRFGRFTGVCVLLHGTVSGLLVTAISSAVVAFLLKYSGFSLQHIHLMLCGLSQCALYLFFSSSTLMATL